jgi:hypothetical protein
MTSDNTLITELISYLKENWITYIYDGPYPTDGPREYDWIAVNTKHMIYSLRQNNIICKNHKYYINIHINNDIKYTSNDIDCIVNYFIQNSHDFTICSLYKKIELEYIFESL